MHFHKTKSASGMQCLFGSAIKADLINLISKYKSKEQMPYFMDRCANKIEKIQNKIAAVFVRKILYSSMPGLPHNKSKQN